MLKEIAFYMIAGKPLFIYFGGLAIVGFLVTASIPYFPKMGIQLNVLVWHKALARISIGLAIIHIILGMSRYF